ncbi:MAG: hypothetical protein A2289_26420 [Deltaproteobacteria bacterium RIFOXYA12_FULL_58_15]|nr:MAG: hypothetical protein A2289_26420 [Deltaproteobacteria bacterium RIFOXYA12_FULL_58_15]
MRFRGNDVQKHSKVVMRCALVPLAFTPATTNSLTAKSFNRRLGRHVAREEEINNRLSPLLVEQTPNKADTKQSGFMHRGAIHSPWFDRNVAGR